MEREYVALLGHQTHKFPVSLDHNNCVTRLQGDYDIEKIRVNAHPEPFHCGYRHGLRRVPVTVSDVRAERTVIHSDPDCRSVFLADLQKGSELLPGLGVVTVEISRVDSYLFHDRSHQQGSLR